MSRRTPIKELIDEDLAPNSPLRKSTRIAAKVVEEKDVPTPARTTRNKRASLQIELTDSKKDDDEISVSSTTSSSSTRRVTRAASKSPTRSTTTDGPARRTRRASSTSSLQETNTAVSSPAPTRRRSTRSMSTSPTSELQENSAGTPSKPRGRRPSISDKIVPMEAIEEKETKPEESEEISPTGNDDNLPFKKKRKTLNLQTIEEKSFCEEPEVKPKEDAEVESTKDAEVETKKDAEVETKKDAEVETKKDAEVETKKDAEVETKKDAEVATKKDTEVEIKKDAEVKPIKGVEVVGEKDVKLQTKNINIIEKPLPKFSLGLLNNKNEKTESEEEKELLAVLNTSASKDFHNTNEKTTVIQNSFDLKSVEESDSVINSSEESGLKKIESPNVPIIENPLSTRAIELNQQQSSKKVTMVLGEDNNQNKSLDIDEIIDLADDNSVTTTNKEVRCETSEPTLESNVSNEIVIIDVDSTYEDHTVEIGNTKNILNPETDEEVGGDSAHDKSLDVIPASQEIALSPKLNDRTNVKRQCLKVSEKLISLSSNSDIKTNDLKTSLNTSSTDQKIKQNDFNDSGSSDASNKENVIDNQENTADKSAISITPTKESSYCDSMKVEQIPDVDKTVCVISNVLVNSPKKRSLRLLQDDNVVNSSSSTPKKLPRNSLSTESQVVKCQVSDIRIEAENVSDNKDSDDKKTSFLENTTNSLASVDDPDEYEENHPSIVQSSDEEAAEAERRAFSKTSTSFETPETNKHPIFSEETYNALVVSADESDKSNDPDFEVTAFSVNSDNDKTMNMINAQIDDLIAKHDGEEESSSEESVTHFLDEFAAEEEESTPSEGSNDIVERGESLGSNTTESDSDEESGDLDSFIDDSEQIELLSGDEYDLDSSEEKTTKKRKRVITLVDSDDNEEPVNDEVQEDDDLEKMSTRPYCGLSPPSVISGRESPLGDEKDGSQESIVINSEDNLQSLEKIKQRVPKLEKSPIPVSIAPATPNNSLSDDSGKGRKRLSSINIQDNISMEDLEQGAVGDRINRVIDAFYSNIKENNANISGSFSLNISLDCVKSPTKNIDDIVGQETPQVEKLQLLKSPEKLQFSSSTKNRLSSTKAGDKLFLSATGKRKSLESPQKLQFDSPEKRLSSSKIEHPSVQNVDLSVSTNKSKSKKIKLSSASSETVEPTVISKIPVRQKETKNHHNVEVLTVSPAIERPVDKSKGRKSINKSFGASMVEDNQHEVELDVSISKKKKKKHNIKDISPDITEHVVTVRNKQVQDNDSDISLDKNVKHKAYSTDNTQSKQEKSSKKRKSQPYTEEVQEVKQHKKVKGNEELVQKKKAKNNKALESENVGWVVEKTKVEYFPSNLLSYIPEEKTNSKDKSDSKPKFLPSTSQDRKSWGYTQAKKLYPSTSNQISSADYTNTLSSKDFKNKMLFNPSRVKREDVESYLRRSQKTKF